MTLAGDARADGAARVVTFDGAVFGFDLAGFTAWVERLMEADGAGALEAITDRVDRLFARAAGLLRELDFEVEGLLGDGLVGVRRGRLEASVLGELRESLARSLGEGSTGAPMRLAAVQGEVVIATLGGWNGRDMRLLTGPAISAYHRSLQALPRPSRPWGPTSAIARADKLFDAEICEQGLLFACVVADGDLSRLDRLVYLSQAAADAAGGELEAVSHDDQGIMLRFCCSTMEAVHDLAERFAALAAETGAQAALGAAFGPLFRSRITMVETPTWTVHGAIVNAAARGAKTGRKAGATGPKRSGGPLMPGWGDLGSVRAAELAALVEAIGSGDRLVRLVGDPGMGKTRLLRRLALALGPAACAAAARPQHGLDAYWLWGRILHRLPGCDRALAAATRLSEAHGTALTRLLRPGSSSARLPAESALPLIGEAIVEALGADGAPRFVLLDDLQWADAPSVRLIPGVLARRPDLVIVTGQRPAERSAVDDVPTIQLAGLSRSELAALLEASGWTGEVEEVDEIASVTGGNPLFAQQLALARRDHAATPHSGIGAVVEARLMRLTSPDRAVLRILAVADRPLRLTDIGALMGGETAPVLTHRLQDLDERDLVRQEAGAYQLVHQVFSEQIRRRLPPTLVPQLHGDIARQLTLAARRDRVEFGRGEIASHWREAGRSAQACLHYLADAEAALEDGDYAAAIAMFDEAERLLPASANGRRALLHASRSVARWGMGLVGLGEKDASAAFRWADEAVRFGRLGRWAAVAGGARRLPRRIRLALLRSSFLRAEAGMFTGNVPGIVAGLLTSIRVAGDAKAQAAAQSRGLAFLGLVAGLARCPRLARLAYDRAQTVPDSKARAYAYASEAVWWLGSSRWPEAAATLDQAEAQLGDAPDPHLREAILTLRALGAQMQGDYTAAAALFVTLTASARDRGNPLHEAWGLYGQAMPLVRLGRAAEALPLIDAAIPLLGELGDRQSTLICLGLRAQAALALDRRSEALDAIEAAIRLKAPPTNFGSLEGFAGPAEVAAALARDAGTRPNERRRALAALKPARRRLRRYANIYPIGRPRLARLLDGRASKPRPLRRTLIQPHL